MKKVCFYVRDTSNGSFGGDVLQLKKTCLNLSDEFHSISTSDLSELKDFKPDIVHFSGINLQYNLIDLIDACLILDNKPLLVLSSIYVNYENYETNVRNSFLIKILLKILGYYKLEFLKECFRLKKFSRTAFFYLFFRHSNYIYSSYLKHVDLFLPNSHTESLAIINDFNINSSKIMVIPNGIQFNTLPTSFNIPYNDYILCVGRIEKLKNQHTLIQACKDLGYKLILIGGLSKSQHSYYKNYVFPLLDDKRIYLGQIPHKHLPLFYKNCILHASVSHFETCGLTSLEACFFKKKIILSDVGYVRSCFGDKFDYCDPFSLDSVKSSIQQALDRKHTINLKLYSWVDVGRLTSECYKRFY